MEQHLTPIISERIPRLEIVNGYDIFMKDLPPLKWIAKPILHEGATLLSGDPKVGKSFLALQVAIAVAGDYENVCGTFEIGLHGPVLYLALDDGSERRIQDRLRQLGANETAVRNIDFVYQRTLPSLSQGFDKIIDSELTKRGYVMVVLDTLGTVLDANPSKSQIYRAEYQEAIKLQKLAQKHGICLLILHHTNKGEGRDPVSRASGSHGLTGAVDSVMILTTKDGIGMLQARPRDGEESEHRLQRAESGGWQAVQGTAVPPGKLSPIPIHTKETEAVISLLKDGPKSSVEIAERLSVAKDTARKRLERIAQRGKIWKNPDGKYELIDVRVSDLSDCPATPIVQ